MVIPSTLSGLERDPRFYSQQFKGDILEDSVADNFGTLKRPGDSDCFPFIGYMDSESFYYTDPWHKRSKNSYSSGPTDFGLPGIVVGLTDAYAVTCIDGIDPMFSKELPYMYAGFKRYVSAVEVETMSREQVERKYSEPISITLLSDGGQRVFYRHLRLKESYNYHGLYIRYNADGTTVVENPALIEDVKNDLFVKRDKRSIISRITSLD